MWRECMKTSFVWLWWVLTMLFFLAMLLFFLFCFFCRQLYLCNSMVLHEHPDLENQKKKIKTWVHYCNSFDVYLSPIRIHTSSSCFSVSFISTSFSNLICSQASSKRLRVTILIFTSRRVFFAAVSKMWFHLLSCWWRHRNIIQIGNVMQLWNVSGPSGLTKRSTHVKASEHTFSSSLWSWYSWLVVCNFSKWCWSSSFRRAFLCWSTCICAFFSFSQSCDLRWRRFSRWTMNKCPSLNWRRQTVTNTSGVLRCVLPQKRLQNVHDKWIAI